MHFWHQIISANSMTKSQRCSLTSELTQNSAKGLVTAMCGSCMKCTAQLVHELDRELLHAQEGNRALRERIRELEAAAEVAMHGN